MTIFQKVISCSLSPNAQTDDTLLALRVLVSPWKWRQGKTVSMVERWFRHYFRVDNAISFNSGRSAFLAILKAFDIGVGDEVLIQAFTCVAVPNGILWLGARPVYVDIDSTYNMDVSDVLKKITSRTKAIVVQHTFGIPAHMKEIKDLARRHNLILIEDCAHALGAKYENQNLGSMGDAAFFSFGRDKVISSVFGGIAIINSKFKTQNTKLKDFQKKLPYPSGYWIFQQVLHPIAFSLILPLYNLGVGKILLFLLQRLNALSLPVSRQERIGKRPDFFPSKYPNALAQLLLHQLKKLDKYNAKRKLIADYYVKSLKTVSNLSLVEGAIYLRFPMVFVNRDNIANFLKKKGILLGKWYQAIIDPVGVNLTRVDYQTGSCPKAEEAAKKILNLPTLVSEKQAKRVVSILTQRI